MSSMSPLSFKLDPLTGLPKAQSRVVANAPVEKSQSSLMKGGITAFAVFLEMASGGLFMENVKMEKQRTSDPYFRIMKRTLSKGIAGFEAGLFPWGLVLGLTKGSVLGAAKVELKYLLQKTGMSSKRSELISGFGAGAVQGVFMSPLLLARTRVNQSLTERAAQGIKTTQTEEFWLGTRVLYDAVKQEGVMVLTSGMMTCILKRAMDWGTRFIFMNMLKDAVKARKAEGESLTDLERLTTSFVGGGMSVLVTMPLDRLMPVIQAASKESVNVVEVIREKFAREGITTLWRGGAMRTLHTGYHTMFAIFISDKIYELVFPNH
eukprot:Clim_evm62s236 gene=Clim_evmTU62s236